MIKVVYGAPASGKSTYVKKHIGENDIVFDYDVMMQAITMKDKYDRNNNASYLLTYIRGVMIRQHTMNNNKIDNIWIVTTNITDKLKEELSSFSEKDVEYIRMKTSLKTCLKRIEEDVQRKHLAEDMKKSAIAWFKRDEEEQAGNKTIYEIIVDELKMQTEMLSGFNNKIS